MQWLKKCWREGWIRSLLEMLRLVRRRPRPLKGVRHMFHGWARGDAVSVPALLNEDVVFWLGDATEEWQEISIEYIPRFNGDIPFLGMQGPDGHYVEFDHVVVWDNSQMVDADMEVSVATPWKVGEVAVLAKQGPKGKTK